MGFSQVPGVHYTDLFAQVVGDVTVRFLLVLCQLMEWDTQLIDVENGFLYGTLDKDIFMEIPDGMKVEKGKCLRLKKYIYRIIQASLVWWKTFLKHLINKNFKLSQAKSCLFVQTDENGICIFVLYVNDAFILGNKEATKKTICDVKEELKLKPNL